MKKICCVGHITHDKIITPQHTDHLNGGTAYYFAHGIARLPQPRFSLVTAVGADDLHRPRPIRVSAHQAQALELVQLVLDGGGAGQAHLLADLTQ